MSTNTGEKPQAKVWFYADKHWAVLANSSGTHLWRLDGTTWTNLLQLSSKTNSKADVKVVGNIVHILLFQGISSQLVSLEYLSSLGTYQFWSQRPSTVTINLPSTVEIANIDMDDNGRMWMAYDGNTEIYVTWSNSPYQSWSAPITVATGLDSDDIGAIIALPGKMGVFWSNQHNERFGFKTHLNGTNPSSWSSDEVPASQSALNIEGGMADDHVNMAVSSDGTLFCAIKTSYDTAGYPTVALLVRRPNGNWDNLYYVSDQGTRPIVILNDILNKLRVVYPEDTGGDNIVYNESSVPNISFGDQRRLITGDYNNPTSIKGNFTSEVAILASTSSQVVGVLASDKLQGPTLEAPKNNYTQLPLETNLSWNSGTNVLSYQVQVSEVNNFSSTFFNQSNITSNSVLINGLANNAIYYWRVRSTTSTGESEWSSIWNFKTTPASANAILVGHWKLEEGSGNNLIDVSEHSNNANVTGNPIWEVGKDGLGLRFNNPNQVANVIDNASLDITDAMTIATWVRPEKTAIQYLVKKADHNNINGYELSLSVDGNVFFRFNQNSSGDTFRVDSQVDYPTDGETWMHIAATYNGSFLRIYIDGVENNSISLSSASPISINQLPLSIGSGNDGLRSFEGTMDEIRLYKTALSASEIFYMANSPLPVSPSNDAIEVSVNPTLSWTPLNGADTYEIQVATDMNFVNKIVDLNGLSDISVQVSSLTNNRLYFWRIRGKNNTGTGIWSDTWSFTTIPLAPVLLSPEDLSINISVTPSLSWNTSTGADTYTLEVAEDSSFNTIIDTQSGLTGTSVIPVGLSYSTTYYWRVFSVSAGGSSESEIWSFTTVPEAPILTTP
ncbi:LamG-like jellyroll fold domain-containing protein, partial [Gillisia marina]|uniref:LamG-like jellyroll fold domain-containing protein n=1 Tax=Gillisia marina TaxID=1167637 RepID=UPI001389CDB0